MTIIKRSGKEANFDEKKIFNAIKKANDSVTESENKLTDDKIQSIVDKIVRYSNKVERAMSVEEVQDKVEEELVKLKAYLVSKNYIVYRYKKSLLRKKNDLDKKILSLVNGENESVKQENANKNPLVASTQRDYIAGELSRDITNRILLPKDVVEAHNKGIIHFHDADYFVSKIFNCCLVNIEDMLQNGTVINKTKIDKPHSFRTACNITTQIIAQISSGQYGGQSISLAHLAPFVDISRKNHLEALEKMFMKTYKSDGHHEIYDLYGSKNIHELGLGYHGEYIVSINKNENGEFQINTLPFSKTELNKKAEELLRKEISDGMQIISYQLLTLNSVNGQAPFVTIFMYLNEAKNEQEKKDLAMLIEAMLNERIRGVKNEVGAWVSPAFPKLIYVLEEDNIEKDQPFWYLTELAAKCTAKRLVPDYISEKVMKSLKLDDKGVGHVFTPMGCLDGKEKILINDGGELLNISFEEAWDHFSKKNEVKVQEGSPDPEKFTYIDLKDVYVFDTLQGMTQCKRIIRNHSTSWQALSFVDEFGSETKLDATSDHKFTLVDGRDVLAEEIDEDMEIYSLKGQLTKVKCKDRISYEVPNGKFSYCLSTDTGHFQVNDIYSHNCRSFLSPWTDREQIIGEEAQTLWNKLLSEGNEEVEHQDHENCSSGKIYPKEKITYKMKGLNEVEKDFEVDYVYKEGDNYTIYLRAPQFYSRFNQGVVSINLPYIALLSKKTGEDFWKLFDEKLEICHRALRCRHERLLGTSSDISPIHWQHGGLARLKPHEKIDKLLYGGYSTISLGYVGLWECVYAMIGKKLDEPEGEELGLKIMDKMNAKVNEWKQAENIGYALYGTPAETLAYKFAKALQKEFGSIEGISDEIYITNSYHINVKEPVDAFYKLSQEAKFQVKSQGGAISYVETANLTGNVDAILAVIKHIYNTIMYAEINTYSDYCHNCGYDGEVSLIKNKQGKYIWHCPNCGNEDLTKMNIVRRVCGYLSAANDVAQGRLGDIHDRVRHL